MTNGNLLFLLKNIVLCLLLLFGTGEKYMDDIRLSLKIENQNFIEGESIQFKVTLENTGNKTLSLHSFEPDNQSVTLAANGQKQLQILGTQMSWKERNGSHIDAPRQYDNFELKPGESQILEGDALAWIGSLPPGEYNLMAAYNSGVNIYTESEQVQIKINPAKPVYHQKVKTNIRLAYALERSAWINQTEDGFNLYLLEDSPDFPSNFFRNCFIKKITEPYNVYPSACNVDPPEAVHLCWLDKDNVLNVIKISKDGEVEETEKYSPGLKNAEILLSPFSDSKGELHLLIMNNSGKEIIYIHLDHNKKFEKQILVSSSQGISNYSVLWDRDEIIHFAWNEKNRSAINYLRYNLNDGNKPEQKELCNVRSNIKNLELFQTVNGETYDEHLYALTSDENTGKYQDFLVDLVSSKPVLYKTLNGINSGGFTFFKSALTVENEPVYIFKDNSDKFYFYSSVNEEIKLLSDSSTKPLPVDSQPELFTTAKFSHKDGIYIGYLEKNRLQYLKVE